jgi:hypothetical protein
VKRVLILAAALLGFASAATAAPADALDEKKVSSGKTALDPGAGYILLHGSGRQGGTFIRVPDAEDLEAFRKERGDAFVKVQKRYQKKLASWESEAKMATAQKKAAPARPVAPDEASFSIGDIETRTAVQFGPDFAYIKDKANGRYSYLMAVKPGTYIWYGPVLFDPSQGFVGLCYCMGSVRFEVKPGVVTNVGNFLTAAPLAEQQKNAPLPDIRHSGGLSGFKVEVPASSAAVDFAVPPSLEKWPVERAVFTASGKFNNIYGIMVSRLPPVPDVLAYERDRVIDAKTGAVVGSGF